MGAFCRSYGIDEAIAAFLPDTYTRYRAGRYTYAAGRTVGGAVVYDDKWLFSHHATDPAGGRVLNAWDLVRVHRFGYLDDGSRATKTAQLPSQRAMTELAMKDRGTARLVAEETAERDALKPDAESYARFRERLGAIECEARNRADDLEEKAAAQTRRTLEAFRSEYLRLMSAFESTAGHVNGELRKIEVTLSQLPRALDQTGSELNELSAWLEKKTEKKPEGKG